MSTKQSFLCIKIKSKGSRGNCMYIESLTLENFRCFSTKTTIQFQKGLNVLVGENDSGKSSILDAIRIALGTIDLSWYRVETSDFSNEDTSKDINISLCFNDLTSDEEAAFLEYLDYVQGKPKLYFNWTCKYLATFVPPRTSIDTTTGSNRNGGKLPNELRERLRVTYLQALRDAQSDLKARRNSRLSQLLRVLPDINSGTHDYVNGASVDDLSLTGIVNLSNHLLEQHGPINNANAQIQGILQNKMLLKSDVVNTSISVAGANLNDERKFVTLLEKLDLSSTSNATCKGKSGLGTSNILSMACELLINDKLGSSFLLIEEPEAHIHAQRQFRLIQSLQTGLNNSDQTNQQIIVTTHSPLLASVVKLENVSIVRQAEVFSLRRGKTRLNDSDYLFLEKYLDATKANLFFAKGVLIVEGPSEELLLPTISKLLGKDLIEYGVSIVNTRSIGFSRFSKIFQPSDSTKDLKIRVACVTDRDVMPNCGPVIFFEEDSYQDQNNWPKNKKWKIDDDVTSENEKKNKLKEFEGQGVKVFVSNHWTLEYDLVYAGLEEEVLTAIARTKGQALFVPDKYKTPEERATYVYSLIRKHSLSKPEVAQNLAIVLEEKYQSQDISILRGKLPDYLVETIPGLRYEVQF